MSAFNLPSQLIFRGNGGSYPPYGAITSDNRGPVVVTFSWIFYSLSGLAALARLATRRSFGPDYWCLLTGWLLLTLDCVAIHLAAENGMGEHISSLPFKRYDAYSRAFYASQILRIIVLALTKIAYLTIFVRLLAESSGQRKMMRKLCLGFIALIALWAFSTSLALALQCGLPHPWDFLNNTCINQRSLYYFNGAFNIVTDLAIVSIPPIIVSGVLLEQSVKVAIISIFGSRLIVSIFAIIELALSPRYFGRDDPTWYNATITIWGQAMVNFSLLTACLPSIKPILNMLQFSLVDCSTLPFWGPSRALSETAQTYRSNSSTLLSHPKSDRRAPAPWPYNCVHNGGGLSVGATA